MRNRRIGLVLIGDELLSGKRTDKHLGKAIALLGQRGLQLSWVRMVGDDIALLTDTLRQSFAEGDIVFSFGGIGATPDDVTRQCAAAAADVELALHPEAAAIIEERFGEEAYPNRILMAEFPEGADIIPNPVNQIAGFSYRHHHFLPGFPNMAWPMLEWVLEYWYRDIFNRTPPVERLMLLQNVAESELIPLMETCIKRFPGVRLASLPSTENRRQIEIGLKGEAAEVIVAGEWFAEELCRMGVSWR